MLYLCATPIGNLGDMTERVISTLKEADLIACEDTRNTIKLLNHFEIKTKMTSYHEFNKYDKAEELINFMQKGMNVALVTDAGTPGISDPGEVLVKRCHESGIPVTSLPGACALINALIISGLPTRRFAFEAFLPYDKKERKEILSEIKNDTRTLIFYEAPHHLLKTLKDLYEALGDREIALCKELTKRFETVLKLRLSEAIAKFEAEDPKGEFVIVIDGRKREEIKLEETEKFLAMTLEEHMEIYLSQGMDKKEAMKAVAKDRGVSKRDIYKELME